MTAATTRSGASPTAFVTLPDALNADVQEWYRWFHRHPELSYEEFGTTARIREILESHGVEILESGLRTGVVAIVRGASAKPVIALRGDIDGLPITENTGLDYASDNAGVMHGCGHDFNLTVALGAAILLNERRALLPGTVKIIFQPAEEGRATAERPTGSVQVLNTGVLDDVEAFFGTHDAAGPVGSILIREGGITGAVDKFQVAIHGKGAHAAEPEDGIDPITVLTNVVQGLQASLGAISTLAIRGCCPSRI